MTGPRSPSGLEKLLFFTAIKGSKEKDSKESQKEKEEHKQETEMLGSRERRKRMERILERRQELNISSRQCEHKKEGLGGKLLEEGSIGKMNSQMCGKK